MDHLLDLGEELHLADSAPTALQVVPRPKPRTCAKWSRIRAEISRTSSMTPKSRERRHERLDRLEKMLPQRAVAGGDAGADEGGASPRQRRVHNAIWPR